MVWRTSDSTAVPCATLAAGRTGQWSQSRKIRGLRFRPPGTQVNRVPLRLRFSGSAPTDFSGLLCFRLPSFLLEYWERAVDRLSDKLRRARVEPPRDRNQPGMLVAG
jgi:hypothetical protein